MPHTDRLRLHPFHIRALTRLTVRKRREANGIHRSTRHRFPTTFFKAAYTTTLVLYVHTTQTPSQTMRRRRRPAQLPVSQCVMRDTTSTWTTSFPRGIQVLGQAADPG